MGGSSQSPRNGKDNPIVFRFPGVSMGILDEAIREHLELKRQHGADRSELKQLEDEAFGSPGRPGDEGAGEDKLAEAPTEFMAPDAPAEQAHGETSGEAVDAPAPRSESAARIADLQEAPQPVEPAEEEQSAAEHEVIAQPDAASAEEPAPEAAEPSPSEPTTEEREVIAEQPTEMHDVEEELAEEEQAEAAGEEDLDEEEDDDFWDEKRLSDELDQALEAPLDSDEQELADEEAPAGEAEEDEETDGETEAPAAPAGDEDVLEETPDFLEESPEDDELWFEQKPPKDFDFDD